MNFNTTLLHKDFGSDRSTGSTLPPIYQVSAFAHESAEKLTVWVTPGRVYSCFKAAAVAKKLLEQQRYESALLQLRAESGPLHALREWLR